MIERHLSRLIDAASVEDVWAIHTEKMAEYGFDRLFYGFTRYKTATSYGDLQDILTLSNHPRSYVDAYLGDGHYLHGPMMRWLNTNIGACSWRWIDEQIAAGGLGEREIAVHQFNRKMGLVAGYSISFMDISERAKGAIGLCARAGMDQDEADSIWTQCGTEIEVANKVMHLKLTQLPYTGQRRPLTPRQREVLEWVAEGKTMQDIATIMALTSATVEKHLRLAREVLDVDTTAQAVAKAATQNQIFVHPTH